MRESVKTARWRWSLRKKREMTKRTLTQVIIFHTISNKTTTMARKLSTSKP